jgi:hypothetical protein
VIIEANVIWVRTTHKYHKRRTIWLCSSKIKAITIKPNALLEALEGRRLKLGDTHPHTIQSLNKLIDLYEAWRKPEEAEKWRAKLLKTEAKTE